MCYPSPYNERDEIYHSILVGGMYETTINTWRNASDCQHRRFRWG